MIPFSDGEKITATGDGTAYHAMPEPHKVYLDQFLLKHGVDGADCYMVTVTEFATYAWRYLKNEDGNRYKDPNDPERAAAEMVMLPSMWGE